MKIEKKSSYILFTSEENNFLDFCTKFEIEVKQYKKENLILHISDNLNVTTKDFSVFLDVSSEKKENNASFVVIITTLDIDDLPEEINVVPTLQEAEDILEMEAIERELGF